MNTLSMFIALLRTPGRFPVVRHGWKLQQVFESKQHSSIASPLDHTGQQSEVDQYWGLHTVTTGIPLFLSRGQSRAVLHNRDRLYPQFKKMMGLYGDHSGETILDYGCGPGNDLLGFALESHAEKMIGIDISPLALRHAQARLSLHAVDPQRIELHCVSDTSAVIPLLDASVDYVHCGGVLMHTSDPEAYLREFARILKPGGTGVIMVYNRDSLWYHLYMPYVVKLRRGQYLDLPDEIAFQKTTDGADCPLARCYRHEDFSAMLERCGLTAKYAGGYLSVFELWNARWYLSRALKDSRLSDEHREFLRGLGYDSHHFPLHRGFSAGIGGVYHIQKNKADRGTPAKEAACAS